MYYEGHLRVCNNAQYVHHVVRPRLQHILFRDDIIGWESFLACKRNRRQVSSFVQLLACEVITDIVCPVSLFICAYVWIVGSDKYLCALFKPFGILCSICNSFVFARPVCDRVLCVSYIRDINFLDVTLCINIVACVCIVLMKMHVFSLYKNICSKQMLYQHHTCEKCNGGHCMEDV